MPIQSFPDRPIHGLHTEELNMDTKAQHTAGPWNVLLDAPSNRHRVICRTGGLVAVVTGDEDARLIAAAPELLAALQATLPWLVLLGDHIGNGTKDAPNGRCDAILAARAALARMQS